jgi:hypothetical protein
MFKFEPSYLIFDFLQLFGHSNVSEKNVTMDIVVRLSEIKPFGESSGLMARFQCDLPTYILAANGFLLITAMWATSLKRF